MKVKGTDRIRMGKWRMETDELQQGFSMTSSVMCCSKQQSGVASELIFFSTHIQTLMEWKRSQQKQQTNTICLKSLAYSLVQGCTVCCTAADSAKIFHWGKSNTVAVLTDIINVATL